MVRVNCPKWWWGWFLRWWINAEIVRIPKGPRIEKFQSRLKFSIPLEIFNLDWKFQSRPSEFPTENRGWWVARLKFSISLENFKILNFFNLWALRDWFLVFSVSDCLCSLFFANSFLSCFKSGWSGRLSVNNAARKELRRLILISRNFLTISADRYCQNHISPDCYLSAATILVFSGWFVFEGENKRKRGAEPQLQIFSESSKPIQIRAYLHAT